MQVSIARHLVGDVSLQVFDCGMKQPVLFVHGFPLNHTQWSNQCEAFTDDFRMIAPDLRGFGHSDASDGKVSMSQFADDLAKLLDKLNVREPVILCGLSMGGYIAFEFFRRHRAKVRALVLCDTKAAADAPEAAENRRKQAGRVMNDGPGFVADAMLPKLFCEATARNSPQIVEQVREVIMATNPAGIAAAQLGMAERADMRGELSNIDVPTLVVCGEHDAISPVAEMREIAAGIRGSRFEVIGAAGHLSPLEQPQAFNRVFEAFIEGLD